MKALIPKKALDSDFLQLYLTGVKARILELVDSSAHGTKVLDTDSLARLELPLPPSDEQETLVERTDKKLSQINRIMANSETAIELLRERRSAVISAAVTGTIDVRDWTPPEPETEEPATA